MEQERWDLFITSDFRSVSYFTGLLGSKDFTFRGCSCKVRMERPVSSHTKALHGGVGLEDDYVLRADGPEDLFSFPWGV